MRARYSPVKVVSSPKPYGPGTAYPLVRSIFSSSSSLDQIAAMVLRARSHSLRYTYSFSMQYKSEDGDWTFEASGSGVDSVVMDSSNQTEGELAANGISLSQASSQSLISASGQLTGPDDSSVGTISNESSVDMTMSDPEFWEGPQRIALPFRSTAFEFLDFTAENPDYSIASITRQSTLSTVQNFPDDNFLSDVTIVAQYTGVPDWSIPLYIDALPSDDLLLDTITVSAFGIVLKKTGGRFIWGDAILTGLSYWTYGVDPDNPTFYTTQNKLWESDGTNISIYDRIVNARLLSP